MSRYIKSLHSSTAWSSVQRP